MVGEAERWTMETFYYFSITFVWLVKAWLVSAHIKVILNSPRDAKDLHKSPGQWNHFVRVVPLGTSYWFPLWSILILLNLGSSEREWGHQLFSSSIFQQIIAFLHQDAQNYGSSAAMWIPKCKSVWYSRDYIRVAEHIDLLIIVSLNFASQRMYFLPSPWIHNLQGIRSESFPSPAQRTRTHSQAH